MAPSTYEGNKKFSVKRFFSKMMASKEKYKSDKLEDELVFDSIPDYHKTEEDKPFSECRESPEENSWENSKTLDENEEEKEEEKKEQKGKGYTKRKNEKTTKNTQDAKNVLNISNVNGTVHIGAAYTQTSTTVHHYFGPQEKEGKKKKEMKLTPKIEALFQCNDKVDMRHIEYLKKHFGQSWREIGVKLKLSSGQLDILENVWKDDLQRISFEILSWWKKKKGDGATVGNLCKKLWESRVFNAQEAVKILCDDLHLFK